MGFFSHALLLMAVFLIRTTWASSPLKVANNLKHGPLTVLTPPGCCSPSEPHDPTTVCVQCRNVTVEERNVGRLDPHTPSPPPYMMIQVKEVVWCVRSSDLALLKESVTLAVGPGACGPNHTGLLAYAFILYPERSSRGKNLCLYVCNRD